MVRLLVHMEGQTEEDFVNGVLCPHLADFGFSSVSARLLGNARRRERRQGICGWDAARQDILCHLREDTGAIHTLMVDYYALPRSGVRAWPGRSDAARLAGIGGAQHVQNAIASDIRSEMGPAFDPSRFIPFVVMHEFEALLFSDCYGFAEAIGQARLEGQLQDVRDAFPTPEHINDSPETAPSKRIESLYGGYQKRFHGVMAIRAVGLEVIRAECPHFDDWLTALEALGKR